MGLGTILTIGGSIISGIGGVLALNADKAKMKEEIIQELSSNETKESEGGDCDE